MSKRHDLAIIQKVIPPYRVPVFAALTRRFNGIVTHSKKRKASDFTIVNEPYFPNVYLKSFYYRDSDTQLVQNLWPVLGKLRPKVIVCEFAIGFASFWILFLLRRLFGYKFVAWTHGVTALEMANPFSSRKSRFKLWVYNHVDALITYSGKRYDILKDHMKDPSKVFLARNTLDLDSLTAFRKKLEEQGRENVKEELGFSRKLNLIFIGRLQPGKGIGLLIDTFESIAGKFDIELHIVGNGQDEELVKAGIDKGLPIRFHGPVYDMEASGRLLFASDLLVIPGDVGLALVHAFAYGLPVLTLQTTELGPVHGPEIEFLEEGSNGLFADPGSLVSTLESLLSDPERMEQLRIGAVRTAEEDCSIEAMLKGFADCLEYLGVDLQAG